MARGKGKAASKSKSPKKVFFLWIEEKFQFPNLQVKSPSKKAAKSPKGEKKAKRAKKDPNAPKRAM